MAHVQGQRKLLLFKDEMIVDNSNLHTEKLVEPIIEFFNGYNTSSIYKKINYFYICIKQLEIEIQKYFKRHQ